MRVRPFSLSLTAPLSTARGDIERREGFLLGVDVDGRRGIGEATPLPGWTESSAECREALERADAGDARAIAEDATDPAPVADAPAARHALALAAHDALARRADRPLAAHLADRAGLHAPADDVPVNATVGDAPPADTAAAARDAVDRGFECLKVKVGAGPLDRDRDRLRAVRDAVGPDVDLRADANAAWDRETAQAAVDAFAPLDLAYLEQPLPAADLSGHAALRGRGVPVAVDETLADRSVAAVIDADAADVLVLKPMCLGGPARAVAAASRAQDAGVTPVVTTTVDAVVARTAAVHVAAAVPDVPPCGLATAELLDDDLAPDPAPVDGGRVGVPDGPGTAGDAFDRLVE